MRHKYTINRKLNYICTIYIIPLIVFLFLCSARRGRCPRRSPRDADAGGEAARTTLLCPAAVLGLLCAALARIEWPAQPRDLLASAQVIITFPVTDLVLRALRKDYSMTATIPACAANFHSRSSNDFIVLTHEAHSFIDIRDVCS